MQVVEKKTRLMLYSTLVEIEVGVELGKNKKHQNISVICKTVQIQIF